MSSKQSAHLGHGAVKAQNNHGPRTEVETLVIIGEGKNRKERRILARYRRKMGYIPTTEGEDQVAAQP